MADLSKLRSEVRRAERLLVGLQAVLRVAEEAQPKVAEKDLVVPRIAREHWVAALSPAPQSLGRIVDKVMQRLFLEPAHRRRVVQRCVVYLNGAIKSGEVIKQGSQGRSTYRRA